MTADLETDEECGPPRENKIAPDLEMNEMSTPTAKDTQKMEKIKQVHLEQVSMLKKNKMNEKKGMQLWKVWSSNYRKGTWFLVHVKWCYKEFFWGFCWII